MTNTQKRVLCDHIAQAGTRLGLAYDLLWEAGPDAVPHDFLQMHEIMPVITAYLRTLPYAGELSCGPLPDSDRMWGTITVYDEWGGAATHVDGFGATEAEALTDALVTILGYMVRRPSE